MLSALLILLGGAQGSAGASERWFDNLEAKSSNGKFQVEATDPGNDGRPRLGCDHFTVTFREATSDRVLWKWHQGVDDNAPVQLIPSDDGFLILEDCAGRFYVFDRSGTRTEVFAALDLIPKEEIDRFLTMTDAGYHWQYFAKQGFFSSGKSSLFYLRTFWGRLFVLDYRSGKRVEDPEVSREVEEHLVSQVREWAKSIDAPVEAICSGNRGNRARDELAENLFLIHEHHIKELEWMVMDALTSESGRRILFFLGDMLRVDPDLREKLLKAEQPPLSTSSPPRAGEETPADRSIFWITLASISPIVLFIALLALRVMRRR